MYVAENPRDSYVFERYALVFKNRSDVTELFKRELRRSLDAKNNLKEKSQDNYTEGHHAANKAYVVNDRSVRSKLDTTNEAEKEPAVLSSNANETRVSGEKAAMLKIELANKIEKDIALSQGNVPKMRRAARKHREQSESGVVNVIESVAVSLPFKDSQTVQQRVEALISGTSSTFGKALVLYAMEPGRAYTKIELKNAAANFLGEDLPFKNCANTLFDYCEHSLLPMGFVLEKYVTRDDKLMKAYAITDDGIKYGKPSVERFILIANYLGLPLHEINGQAHSPGLLIHNYLAAKILQILMDSDAAHTESEMAKAMDLDSKVVSRALHHLSDLGLIDYQSIRRDPYGASESGFSVAVLVNREKLERYIADKKELKKDVLASGSHYRCWSNLRRTLRFRQEELEHTALAEKLNSEIKLNMTEKNHESSKIIATLVALGVYAYEGFNGKGVLSDVQLTEKGRTCFKFAYEQVLLAANDSTSQHAFDAYEELFRIRSRVVDLFRLEKQRYMQTSKMLNRTGRDDSAEQVLNTINEMQLGDFRRKDLAELLRKDKRRHWRVPFKTSE